jgi:tetratricopeptide (TPR) repeat protein
LDDFLWALGVAPDRLPADVHRQAALYRTLTAGRSLLVLLDSAGSTQQVRPLLPASTSCLVVVTTRTRLSGLWSDGARFIAVKPLSEQPAITLLSAAGGPKIVEDHVSAKALVDLCAGLPLALSVTAASLAARPWRPVRELAKQLAGQQRLATLSTEEQSPMESLKAAFDQSYRELPEQVARCYRLMGLHPGRAFGVAVTAAVLGVVHAEAADLLDYLVEASLLDVAGDRYQFLDPIREHARQLAEAGPEPDWATATRRIIEYYLAGALAADRTLTPYRRRPPVALIHLPADAVTFDGREAALGWLQRERVNLVDTVVSAAVESSELAWKLADAMWPLFHLGRHHHDRQTVDQVAQDCARRLNNPKYQCLSARRAAYGHYDRGELDQAAALFTESLALAEQHGDDHDRAAALGGLGTVALQQGHPDQAAGFFARELELHNSYGERRGCAMALLHLGTTASASGHLRDALAYLDRAETIFAGLDQTVADPYNATRAVIQRGRVLTQTGQPQQAAQALRHALQQMAMLGAARGQAEAHQALGELAASQGDTATALVELGHAVEMFDELGDIEADDIRHRIATLLPAPKGDQ